MTDEALLEDFINFIRKQLHYGSSKMPLLNAVIGDYTAQAGEAEKLIAGLQKLNAIKSTGDNAVIDVEKLV